MAEEFEFSQISMPHGYAGLYRQGDQPFNVLLDEAGRPKLFETSLQAIRAAKAHVMAKAEDVAAAKGNDVAWVEEWRRERKASYDQEKAILETGRFRPFIVERKKGKKVVKPQA